jgi:hypothetical protein
MRIGLLTLTLPLLLLAASLTHAQNPQGHNRLLVPARVPIVIDRPGNYFIDRNWRVRLDEGRRVAIRVRASSVTLDLRGFALYAEGDGSTIAVEGSNFTLRNGRVGGTTNQIVTSGAARTIVRDLTVIGGTGGFDMRGSQALVKNIDTENSSVFLRGARGALDSSRLRCRFPCVVTSSDGRITNSHIRSSQSEGVILNGDRAVLSGNVITHTESTALLIRGNDNVVLNNIFLTHEDSGPSPSAIYVGGTRNVLRDNLAPPILARWGSGITFAGSGNFYGNNQMAADVPFNLVSGDQTDWGGNFGF